MEKPETVRVLIVDDHAVVRSGLRLLLDANDDVEVVGEAGSARDAIFRARELKPAVILLDVMMPDQSGLEVLPQLLHEPGLHAQRQRQDQDSGPGRAALQLQASDR